MKLKNTLLSGINPLAYVGVESVSTVGLVEYKRAPTAGDSKNFIIGLFWLDTSTNHLWTLAALTGGSATWKRLGEFTEGTSSFPTDAGTATVALGIINFLGGVAIETTGAGNSTDTSLTNGTDGQLLLGSTAGNAAWSNLTSTGGTVTITEGSNTLNIDVSGGGAAIQTFTSDIGVATPAGGIVTFAGGTNITTVAGASTLTANLDANVTLTGALTLTDLGVGVMQTDVSGEAFSDNGLDGQVLIGGGTEPNWRNITSLDGTITVTDGPNTINLESSGGTAGEASFLAYQLSNTGNVILRGVTDYYLGAANPVLTPVFNMGGSFYGGDAAGTPASFTAPSTGKYMLNCVVTYFGTTFHFPFSGYPSNFELSIVTSNRTYKQVTMTHNNQWESLCPTITVCADMDAGDTAQYHTYVSWPGPGVDPMFSTPKPYQIRGAVWDAGTYYHRTWVSGYKVA